MTNLKNRTSFILHLDSLEIVEEMTGDQVKLFLQSIIQWHKNKTLPDLDFGMKMAIKPFLNQFIRDNEKWKDSSESGRVGNLKKWHPKIYQRFFSKEITLEEAENLVKLKNSSPPIAPDKIISPPIKPDEIKSGNDRDSSLSVSVSVSDSVINTDILLNTLKTNNIIKEDNSQYLSLANGLIFILKAKLNRSFTESTAKAWEKEIRLLIERDLKNRDNPVEDVKKAIQDISDNWGAAYFPVIQSATALREKFTKIEAFIARKNTAPPLSKAEQKSRDNAEIIWNTKL